MNQFAVVSPSNVIITFLGGDNLTIADSPTQGDGFKVVELPEIVTYSKRDLLEILFRLSNDVRVLQGQTARTRKQFLKFLGGLT